MTVPENPRPDHQYHPEADLYAPPAPAPEPSAPERSALGTTLAVILAILAIVVVGWLALASGLLDGDTSTVVPDDTDVNINDSTDTTTDSSTGSDDGG